MNTMTLACPVLRRLPPSDAGFEEQAAEVDRLDRGVVPDLEFDAIDLETDALSGERPGLAVETAVFDRVGGWGTGRRPCSVPHPPC